MNAEGRAHALDTTIRRLLTDTPDITGCALVSDDGLIISSVLPQDIDEDSIGGMASILLSLSSRVSGELGQDEPQRVLIEGLGGKVLMLQITEGVLMMALLTKRAKLGLVFMELRRAKQKLEQML